MLNSIISVGLLGLLVSSTEGQIFRSSVGNVPLPGFFGIPVQPGFFHNLLQPQPAIQPQPALQPQPGLQPQPAIQPQPTLRLQPVKTQVISESCLDCLCYASNNCSVTQGCSSKGIYLCGPFKISIGYWIDAGRPVLVGDNPETNQGAFENCVLDIQCAAETVQRYMSQFDHDCNGDQKIDCQDFARMHRLGGYSCTGNDGFVGTQYAKKFSECNNARK